MATGSSPARFISIPDLLATSDPTQEGLLRIIGRVEAYNIKHSIIWIQDHLTPSLQVAVDSSNIEPFPFRAATLYQFIGEVNYRDVPTDSGPVRCAVMSALVCRCMDGLNMDVYLRAQEARMRDLNSSQKPPATAGTMS